jgi:hypothetical protein
MSKNQIAYFFCASNDVYHGVFQRQTCFLSSPFSAPSLAFPLIDDEESIRRAVALFYCRSLPRSRVNWLIDSDRFLGRD